MLRRGVLVLGVVVVGCGAEADRGAASLDAAVAVDAAPNVGDAETPGPPDAAPPAPLPAFAELPVRPEVPPVLETLDGRVIDTAEAWRAVRRPELLRLFSHYVYGFAPAEVPAVQVEVQHVDRDYFDGLATKKRVRLTYGAAGTPPLDLLVITPNGPGPAPVFLGANFFGNHATIDDPEIPLTEGWVPTRGEGVVDNRATEASRGTVAYRWPFRDAVERGYGLATFYHGDVESDAPIEGDGIRRHFPSPSGDPRHDWGVLAAWAFGLSRAVDYLVTDADVDGARIAAVGHSRNGKVALWGGALDERIALVVSNMSGCLGAALSRRDVGENVALITAVFPWWWPTVLSQFADAEEKLPIDQHLLIALLAPRPVLVVSGEEDTWADPEGEFLAARLAGPAWRLLGSEALPDDAPWPLVGAPSLTRVGYARIAGGHEIGAPTWAVAFDFADRWLR